MKPTAEMAKVKNWIFNDLATRHPVKLVVGLVLGAVVLSGTALYFGPNQFQEERSPVPGGIASAVHNSTADRTLSNIESRPLSNREIERLESQIASLLADAARDPSRNTPQLNREIERLDNEIDMLRLNAMQNQSADGPLSSEQDKAVRPLSDSRAIERLEEQISIMLFNAARAGKPLSKKEIERLDAQMDLMLAAEAQDRSVTRTGGRMK
jgi:hypothetical protein